MSVATILNDRGEIEYPNIATDNVRFKSNTQEQNLSASIIQTLINRIEVLEQYILAHQETYHIFDGKGDILRVRKYESGTTALWKTDPSLKEVIPPAPSIPE